MTWKWCGAMEMPHHGNASKKNGLIKLIYCRLLSLKKSILTIILPLI